MNKDRLGSELILLSVLSCSCLAMVYICVIWLKLYRLSTTMPILWKVAPYRSIVSYMIIGTLDCIQRTVCFMASLPLLFVIKGLVLF